jgi:hypothetical protein
MQDDVALQKERHILQLKMLENPSTAAAATAPKAGQAPAAQVRTERRILKLKVLERHQHRCRIHLQLRAFQSGVWTRCVMQDDAALQKERHILKLKMLENPSAAAAAAAAKAGQAPATQAQKSAQAADKRTPKAAAKADSGGSGIFDDVDDAYEVDLKPSKQKDADKAAGQVCSLPLLPVTIVWLHIACSDQWFS